jgi:hypothetical protein
MIPPEHKRRGVAGEMSVVKVRTVRVQPEMDEAVMVSPMPQFCETGG